jgi:hypothetical protein
MPTTPTTPLQAIPLRGSPAPEHTNLRRELSIYRILVLKTEAARLVVQASVNPKGPCWEVNNRIWQALERLESEQHDLLLALCEDQVRSMCEDGP